MEAGYFVVESKIVFRLAWFGFEVASKESGVVNDDGPVYVSVFSSCRKYSGLQQVMNIGKQIRVIYLHVTDYIDRAEYVEPASQLRFVFV